jgi:hypothetical protein
MQPAPPIALDHRLPVRMTDAADIKWLHAHLGEFLHEASPSKGQTGGPVMSNRSSNIGAAHDSASPSMDPTGEHATGGHDVPVMSNRSSNIGAAPHSASPSMDPTGRQATGGHGVGRGRVSTIEGASGLTLAERVQIDANKAAALAIRATRQVRDAEVARLGAKLVAAVAEAAFWRQAEAATKAAEDVVAAEAEVAAAAVRPRRHLRPRLQPRRGAGHRSQRLRLRLGLRLGLRAAHAEGDAGVEALGP